MPLKAQTAKFDSTKKASEQATITPAVGRMPRQRRVSMPAMAGSEMAA